MNRTYLQTRYRADVDGTPFDRTTLLASLG